MTRWVWSRRVIADLNLDDKQYRPLAILNSISNAKNELILPDEYPLQTYRDEVVKRVYIGYQQMLLTNNAVDFDDLLLYTAFLLDDNPAVRERYARRYEHVLVDEFQDTNLAQYVLLRRLSSYHNNIFAVGDADQSIYRWRGADYRNVLRFEQDYPDAPGHFAGTELPLHATDPGCSHGDHRSEPKPHPKKIVYRTQ